MKEFTFRHIVEIIDQPEEYTFAEFARNLAVMDVETVFYNNNKLYAIDYEVADAVIDGCFALIEVVTSASFCRVNEYRKWILYHGNEDEAEYVSKIEKIRGDTAIINVVRSENRFVKKVDELISTGRYKSFVR